jgi:glycosidase
MPVHPISEKNRKGTLGSYYSVRDYQGINPEFGTLDDFKRLVNRSHELGMKVIIDWVANHTGWDHRWISEHPDWYTQDSTGAIISPNPDWSDIADLNFAVQPMRREMIREMQYWLRETDIDGFRCDVAWGVPQDFWEEARNSLDSVKPVYMLAEDEDHPEFLEKAFDSNYAWKLHHLTNDVAQGKKNAGVIKAYFDSLPPYANGSFPMQFITNHDENSWAGTVQERMGAAADAFAVLSFTVPGIPLIYGGQEAGLNKRLAFFEKDTIRWSDLSKLDFYAGLIRLKTENPALWNGEEGGSIKFLTTNKPDQVLAWIREKNENKVLVVMNLFSQPVVLNAEFGVQQEMKEWFDKETLVGEKVNIELLPWEYRVYSCK